jgi:hypothetical protein
MLTAFGVAALTFMMLMYALEHRHPRFTLAFAAGTWPFGVVELMWSAIAVRRYRELGT